MVEIIWTPFALEDLQSVYDHIAQDSPTYASRYIDKLVDSVDILLNIPKQVELCQNLKMNPFAN